MYSLYERYKYVEYAEREYILFVDSNNIILKDETILIISRYDRI